MIENVSVKSVLETSQDYVFLYDKEGKLIHINSSLEELSKHLCYPENELKMWKIDNYLCSFPIYAEDLKDCFSKGKSCRGELFCQRYEKTVCLEYWINNISDEDGDFSGVVTFIRDVTEQRVVEEKFKSETEKLANFLDIAGVFIGTFKPSGEILFLNKKAEEMLGYTLDELKGKDYVSLFIPERFRQQVRRVFDDILLEEGGELNENPIIARNGIERMVRWHNAVTRDNDGKITAIICSGEDITDFAKVHLDLRKNIKKLRKMSEGVIVAISKLVEMRDPYTAGHQRRVAYLASAIAREMGISIKGIEIINTAAILHDLGKIEIPSELLNKPGKISDLEFSIIKRHSLVAYEVLKNIEFEGPVPEIILQHHERLDGSGYPEGLKDGEIFLEARIIAVADVVEAMMSHRPYRPALGLDVALEEIERGAGTLYDPDVVKVCLKVFKEDNFDFHS